MLKIKEEPVEIEEWDDTTHSAIPLYDVDTDVKVEKLDSSYLNNEICQESSCHNDETSEKLHQVEQIEIVAPSVPIQQDISVLHGTHHGTSSLPATQTWPGEYGFTVSFNPQNKNTKGISWTYSKIKDKLYVGKDVPCPINFSANTIVPNDVYVRVMALYTSPGQVFENVRRCVNHSMEEIQNGVTEAEHLIRCDSTRASYEVDATTGHLSVRVPFENPAAGQPFSTYIYKFACFGSCAGGPNRRPLILVFTLEKENKVLGRRKLDVKICACPGRDRKAEEAQCIVEENSQGSILKQKDQEEFVNLSDAFSFTKSVNCLPARKSYKLLPNKDGCYIIPAGNKECYEFLLQMKKLYEICSSMSGLSPDIMKALRHYHKRKLYEKI